MVPAGVGGIAGYILEITIIDSCYAMSQVVDGATSTSKEV